MLGGPPSSLTAASIDPSTGQVRSSVRGRASPIVIGDLPCRWNIDDMIGDLCIILKCIGRLTVVPTARGSPLTVPTTANNNGRR
jgi:hypothetical protein